MSQPTNLKARINCTLARCNHETMKYETKQGTYSSLKELAQIDALNKRDRNLEEH